MRFRTLEIRWHDSKPISSCEFQPMPSIKKARPADPSSDQWATQAYRLATAGEDNHVRLWMVHPNIRPSFATASETGEPATGEATGSATPAPPPPRIEYLATLSKHTAPVNVVRWSPNGELIASAGDDGMLIVWSQSNTPQVASYGSELSAEELAHEKEFWRARIVVSCTRMQVYDLAWSPTGEYIITGSTDNVARIYDTSNGACIHEIAEHKHYVQGVAWDPLNEFLATQSSDKSMHVHKISTATSSGNKSGKFETHAIGRNTNVPLNLGTGSRARRHARTASTVSEGKQGRAGSRPAMLRRESITSDAESVASEVPVKEDGPSSALFSTVSTPSRETAPLTPATSVASTPSFPPVAFNTSMFPPPPLDKEKPQSSSRRSSFSGSNAPPSPAPSARSMNSRYGRSPSPMPALPAIRPAASPEKWKSVNLYGDESYSNFFRRLAFSPDGGLLVTPAGHFEDPEIVLPPLKALPEETPPRGRKTRPSISTDAAFLNASAAEKEKNDKSSSCVYIYTRSSFARPPIAQLPGYKKPSVAVKFNPLLFNLRPGVSLPGATVPAKSECDHKGTETKIAVLEKDKEGSIDVDILGGLPQEPPSTSSATPSSQRRTPHSRSQSQTVIAAPAPRAPGSLSGSFLLSSPTASPVDSTSNSIRPPTPASSKPGTPIRVTSTPVPTAGNGTMTTGSVFALPYRMLFAVVTMDTIAIYDTQQSGPICMLTKLHYDEFTDVSWSPDGQCVVLSSRDGYCTLIIFDEILPVYHTQQQALQLQSIAHNHSVPIAYPTPTPSSSRSGDQSTPLATPVFGNVGLPPPMSAKKSGSGSEPPLTPAASVDGDISMTVSTSTLYDLGHKREREDGKTEEGSTSTSVTGEPAKKKRRIALTRVGDLDS